MSKAGAFKRNSTVRASSDPHGITQSIEIGIGTASEVVNSTIQAVVSAPFDIIVWLKNNWQLAIIGAVSILILVKD